MAVGLAQTCDGDDTMRLLRTLVISDVHSNLDALDAVLADAATRDAGGRVFCLGDIVGYNAQPREVIARLREVGAICVAGNHDLAAAGLIGVEEFNAVAAEAALWSGEQLGDDERAYLAGLPLTQVVDDATLVHGSLRDPVWEYLLDRFAAEAQFALQQTRVGFVGHSHIPFAAVDTPGGGTPRPMLDGTRLALSRDRAIVNPGSVGQPRDGDPRASYAVYDDGTQTITWHRVAYDVAAAQRRVREAGLPEVLALRLARGR